MLFSSRMFWCIRRVNFILTHRLLVSDVVIDPETVEKIVHEVHELLLPRDALHIACVASVSVGFPHKFRCFGRAKIGARAKMKEGGGGEEKRKRLQSNPWNLKTPFASERGS